MVTQPERLTEKEAAAELRRCPQTLKRWRRLRKGPEYLRLNGRVLYERTKLEAWLQAQQAAA
jgi:hypothetical protein